MNNVVNQSMLIISAVTPVVIFSKLFISRLRLSFPVPTEILDLVISEHFRQSLNHKVKITRGYETLNGYFLAFSTGEYIFYLSDHTGIIHLKKGNSGWAIIKISNDDYRKFITPAILHLEARLFN